MSSSVTINITSAGAQPTPPATLLNNLLTAVSAEVPNYTASLPASLIEDMSSTAVGALVMIDQATVDLINSNTPSTSNPLTLMQQGQQMGITQGLLSNSSAYCLFTGIAGYAIVQGFIISDGTNYYTVQDNGVLGNPVASTYTAGIAAGVMTVSAIGSGQIMVGDSVAYSGSPAGLVVTSFIGGTGGTGTYGVSSLTASTSGGTAIAGPTHGTNMMYCVANNFGTWAIPANSITSIVSSVPTGYPLTVSNQTSGIIGQTQESTDIYRARVQQAQTAPGTGTLAYLKSEIQEISGVQSRLVSVSGNSKIMVGGGDPYLVAGAILFALFDIGDLIGSSVHSNSWTATGCTIAANQLTVGSVTGTILVNDIVSGLNVANPTIILKQISGTTGGAGVYQINYSQSIPAAQAMTGAQSVRNQVIPLINYPDTYWILFVVPVSQTVTIACNWSTIAPNFTANTAVQTSVSTAWANYINSIAVGQDINTYELNQIFLDTVSQYVNPGFISALSITVSINGTPTSPLTGTGLIQGDSEGYMTCSTTEIVLTRV